MEIKVPKTCEVACVVKMKKSDKDAFVRAIDDEYRVHWSVDNLPVGKLECKEYDSIITDFFLCFLFPLFSSLVLTCMFLSSIRPLYGFIPLFLPSLLLFYKLHIFA